MAEDFFTGFDVFTFTLCDGVAYEVGPTLIFNDVECEVLEWSHDATTGRTSITVRVPRGHIDYAETISPAGVSVGFEEKRREGSCRTEWTRLITIRK